MDPALPETQALALRFLQFAQGHEHLYILGDLFEYWLGDDAGLNQYDLFIQALAHLADTGCAITIMLGNRDFLLGDAFAQASKTTLLTEDELKIQLAKTSVLLMHGDTLCTDDADYQRFRAMVRQNQWQEQFLSQCIDTRIAQAQGMRTASKNASATKQNSIMDVNTLEVANRLQLTGCSVLIHGHTHRPAQHEIKTIDATRWVVGDWQRDHAKYVRWDGEQLSLNTFKQ